MIRQCSQYCQKTPCRTPISILFYFWC